MKYAEYKKKMEKIGKAINVLYRFRIPIIATIAVAVTAAFTMTGLNGQAKEVKITKTELVYGETPEAFGKSMFGDALLQYSLANQNDWSYEVPYRSGVYKVRAVSKNGYGVDTYSAAKEFTILPKPLEINLNTKELTYGNQISYTNNLNPGDKIDTLDFVFADNYKEANPFGENPTFDTTVTIDMSTLKIVDSELNDVTYCYSYPNENKDIKIKKRSLHLVSSQVSKDYDGKELSNENFYASLDTSLAEGDEMSLSEKTSITEVGQIDVKNNVVIKHDELDRTAFYDIVWDTPQLTITKRKLTLTTNNIDRYYNGKRLSSNPETSTDNLLSYNIASGSLAEGHQFVLENFASENAYKPLQNSPNSISYKIIDKDGDDVTEKYYDITENFGKINIRKANATISYTQLSKEFDYQPIEGGAMATGLIGDDKLTYTLKDGYASDSIDVIGSLIYSYDFSIVNDELGPVDDCYNIQCETETGTLTIKQKTFNISSNDLNIIYDGVPFSSSATAEENHKLQVEYNGLLEGHKAEVTFNNENSLFANTDNAFNVTIKDADNNDVSSLYNIHASYGKINTSKRNLTIKFSDNSWVFDNQYHQEESYNKVGPDETDGLADGDEIIFTSSYPSVRNVGTYQNNRDFYISRGGIDVTSYYNIPSTISGTLKIDKRPLTIKYTEPSDKMYDGQYINVDYSDITIENLPSDLTYNLTVGGIGGYKRAGQYNIDLTNINIYNPANPEEDLTNNFSFIYEGQQYDTIDNGIHLGDFKITKRPITLSTYSMTKIYDSTALTSYDAATNAGATEVWVDTAGEGLVTGDTVQVNTTSSIINKGTIVNEITYTINSSDGDVTSCYEIDTDFGNLTVEPADLTIELTNNSNYVYDSLYHEIDLTNTSTGLQGLDVLSFSTNSFRDAGTYSLSDCFSVQVFNNDGIEVTSNYNIVDIIGSPMVISPYQLNIYMADFQRDLFNRQIPPISYSDNFGPVYDTFNLQYSGTKEQILERISQGLYPYVKYTLLHSEDGKDAASNYDVNIVYGTNTLTTTDVTISLNGNYLNNPTFIYRDAEINEINEAWYQECLYHDNTTTLPSSYYYSGIKSIPDRTLKEPGEYTMTLVEKENIKIMYSNPETGEQEDVTSYFNISFGNQTTKVYVKKARIYIHATAVESIYDSQYYSIPFEFIEGYFIGDHHIEVNGYDMARDAGVYEYVFDDISDLSVKDSQGNDVTYLYDFDVDTSLYGQTLTRTINKRNIRFTSPSLSKTFDGKAFSDSDIRYMASQGNYFTAGIDYDGDGNFDGNEYLGSYGNTINYYYGKDRFELRLPLLSPSYHVGEYNNQFEVIYYDNGGATGSLTSNNYQTYVSFGKLNINKLVISYKVNKTNKTYDGNSYISTDDLRDNNNTLVFLNVSVLPEEVRNYLITISNGAYVYIYSDNMSFLVGNYSLAPTFVIMFNGENLVETGDIEFVSTNGNVSAKINKRTLTIGNEEQEIVVTRWNPRASEQLTVNGLVESYDYIMIGDERYSTDAINYTIIQDMKTPGVYGAEYLSSYINSSTVRVYRNVNGTPVDVTNCYTIKYDFKNITVTDI